MAQTTSTQLFVHLYHQFCAFFSLIVLAHNVVFFKLILYLFIFFANTKGDNYRLLCVVVRMFFFGVLIFCVDYYVLLNGKAVDPRTPKQGDQLSATKFVLDKRLQWTQQIADDVKKPGEFCIN